MTTAEQWHIEVEESTWWRQQRIDEIEQRYMQDMTSIADREQGFVQYNWKSHLINVDTRNARTIEDYASQTWCQF